MSRQIGHKAFGATQLLADMIMLNLRDRIDNDAFNRRMAEAWLRGDDAGMASFETCCEHLATVSDLLEERERAALAATLNLSEEHLHKPSEWRLAFSKLTSHEQIDQTFDQLERHLIAQVNPLREENSQEREDAEMQRDTPSSHRPSDPSL